mgnify:CR=1 FL=1
MHANLFFITGPLQHEMAHVLGFGTLWNINGLYTDGTGVFNLNTNAQSEWEAIGCTGRLPVELDGGPGTVDGHWVSVAVVISQ